MRRELPVKQAVASNELRYRPIPKNQSGGMCGLLFSVETNASTACFPDSVMASATAAKRDAIAGPTVGRDETVAAAAETAVAVAFTELWISSASAACTISLAAALTSVSLNVWRL
jgi:hypothetical protein